MSENDIRETAEKFLRAWDTQDPDIVANCYAQDLRYRDPNTRGEITSREQFKKYVSRLFEGWSMSWSVREVHELDGAGGYALLWRGKFTKTSGGPTVECDGMDLVLVRDGLVSRNEVYFDRTVLPA